jgi:hypothetical protein
MIAFETGNSSSNYFGCSEIEISGGEGGTVATRYCNARTERKLTQHLVDATSVGLGNNIRSVATKNIDDCEALVRFWKGMH